MKLVFVKINILKLNSANSDKYYLALLKKYKVWIYTPRVTTFNIKKRRLERISSLMIMELKSLFSKFQSGTCFIGQVGFF
jgi:hypothetical protein